jgi:class 3 adenylate cyclase
VNVTTIESTEKLDSAAESEARLIRAAELAEYLRQNPKETRRDADELGSRFGLSTSVVVQIQSSVRSRSIASPSPNQGMAIRFKVVWRRVAHLAERCVAQPFVFQVIAAIVTAFVGLVGGGNAAIAAAVWCGLQAWCLLVKPRFRYSAFGSLLIWGVAGAMFFEAIRGEKPPMPLPLSVIVILCGWSMAFLNLMLGGILVVMGGSIQMAAQKRRSAARSRQDLIIRMFELQHQIAVLPPRSSHKMPAWIAFVRQHLFLTTAALMFFTASLSHANALLFHVDIFALQQAQVLQQSHPSKPSIVVIAPGLNSSSFVAIASILGFLEVAIRIFLAVIANSWRKVWHVAAGILAGAAAATAWAIPAGALGSTPPAMVVVLPAQEAVSGLVLVLLVRFVVGFNRALSAFRKGGSPDEAALVGELLEVRYRLSAHPEVVCVLVVDAAGSTQMKKSEDPLRVEYSFGSYQNWIGRVIAANNGKVEIRTGDGAICAFGSAEAAMAAAVQMQTDLREFNETENKLNIPFRLRVALHAGLVHADLEKVQFTEVIDVAAHTEKHSPIGGIALTEAFVQTLAVPPSLPVCATVDGFAVHPMTL